jgi:hypothetical protein
MSNEVFKAPARLESLSKEVGFDVPVEAVPLPSKGLAYPPEHPLCGSEFVEIRCMTAKEEDLLTSRALLKTGTMVTHLIKSCLINKAVDPGDLLVGDRNALLVALRITGYGSDYDAKVSCPECEEAFDHTFSLTNLKIKELGAQPAVPNSNVFSYKLPISGLEVRFKLPTGNDELDMSREAEGKKKLGSKIESTVTSRLFYTVLSIGGETNKETLRRQISNLRAGDSQKLRAYMDSISPNIDMHQKVLCPHCNVESEVVMPLGIGFFWPDLGK